MAIPILDWFVHPSHFPLAGSLFGKTPEQEHVEQQLGQMAQAYQQYRDPAAATRMTGLSQQLGAYGPANTAIGDIYGSRYQMDMRPMMHNPMAAGQTSIGAPPGTPGVSQLLKPGGR